ncbi:MAG: C13 family peptidase [Cyanomargarita calcarea GSE-NOS-MK-12-04C]|jgi:hypothetical protein|uniref:C13 family peptidase n=1 Tax=Cyanomargarita calcarea GSE-NOS-MK-12-04C TaxID=2839659 RepID=A0A951QRR9_9CYAN|nr:C13 family peptidase [Cyanomargarita calcarea GSE-NOS-MK-12-04C]
MRNYSQIRRLFGSFVCGLLVVASPSSIAAKTQLAENSQTTCQGMTAPNFLVVGGGGAPSYNEIALEKNVLYFQRTLEFMGYNPQAASIFFANGNDGKASVRYIDSQGKEQFKVPEILNVKGATTLSNLQSYFQELASLKDNKPLFLYFTGHGGKNAKDLENNYFYLWNDDSLSVKQLAKMLDKSPQKPVVMMMSQCFSGSFANFIYEGGDPKRPLALQTRCGFFATIKTLPSVGCTPEVNEADYKDYSSSFFAGLSGRDRTGKKVASADYNQDGKISYMEAHAFAKVDEKTRDFPISTSESWLQRKVNEKQQAIILSQPITDSLKTARIEQQYVINSLISILQLDKQKSYLENYKNFTSKTKTDVQQGYMGRLQMQLIDIAVEKEIRSSGNKKDIAMLNKLLKCESGYLAK